MFLAECALDALGGWLARGPGERSTAQAAQRFEQQLQALRQTGHVACPMAPRPDWQFDPPLGERKLLEHLGAATLQTWDAQDLPLSVRRRRPAAVRRTPRTASSPTSIACACNARRSLIAHPPARALTLNSSDPARRRRNPTLLSLLDTCMTGMGSRLLRTGLLEPRRERRGRQRLAATTALRSDASATRAPWQALRDQLRASAMSNASLPAASPAPGAPARTGGAIAKLQKPELFARMDGRQSPIWLKFSSACDHPLAAPCCWRARWPKNPPPWCATAA